ncbi:MAG TPA: FAD/NAD(P)-binding protein, partial [Bdellovibrionales bacterium]|nr:FAD/NAD(P)-binding protein [Bdellovibrionales bacterium]
MWRIDRRTFLQSAAAGGAACAAGLLAWQPWRNRAIPGRIVGASHEAGHILRDPAFKAEPTEHLDVGVLIVGSGIAGLSAARQLEKSGVRDFMIVDLEKDAGGNAVSGANHVSAYPWGAHYLPLPNKETVHVRELLEELGVITGYDRAGLPVFDELHLCAEPDERLHIHGRWQDGLVPSVGLSSEDRRQFDEFFALVKKLRSARGRDGRPAFAIPLDLSSRDETYTSYDAITMSELMRKNGWSSEKLNWYVDYCCRDDYGTTAAQTSAWAGLHYFAGRRGLAANADSETVLTWPSGNGWLVEKLRARVNDRLRLSTMAIKVRMTGDGALADTLDVRTKTVTRVRARTLIWAAPRFLAARVIENGPKDDGFTYAPWMVANLTLKDAPPEVTA